MISPKKAAAALIGSLLLAPGALAQQKAHEHGHWQMNAAVEGNMLLIELIAPGADVAGFEHEARTASEKAKVWTGIEKLKAADSLFAFTPAAGCVLASADAAAAKLDREGHGDNGRHGQTEKHEETHNEYHAEYRFTCAEMAALESIRVGIFTVFPTAAEVEAAVLSGKGQRAAELTAAAPVLSLDGLF
jgi:hypothetical protein